MSHLHLLVPVILQFNAARLKSTCKMSLSVSLECCLTSRVAFIGYHGPYRRNRHDNEVGVNRYVSDGNNTHSRRADPFKNNFHQILTATVLFSVSRGCPARDDSHGNEKVIRGGASICDHQARIGNLVHQHLQLQMK